MSQPLLWAYSLIDNRVLEAGLTRKDMHVCVVGALVRAVGFRRPRPMLQRFLELVRFANAFVLSRRFHPTFLLGCSYDCRVVVFPGAPLLLQSLTRLRRRLFEKVGHDSNEASALPTSLKIAVYDTTGVKLPTDGADHDSLRLRLRLHSGH